MTTTTDSTTVGSVDHDEDIDIYSRTPVTQKPEPVFIRMRKETWREALATKGIASDIVLASRLGFTPSTVWRIRSGENMPSSKFIGQSCRLLGLGMDDLFEIVDAGSESEADSQGEAAA